MISLTTLAELARRNAEDLNRPVEPLCLGQKRFDVDQSPVVMGCLNLSRDSTYRESIAVSSEAAVRKARVMIAQGAQWVDLGAESSTAKAARVSSQGQQALLLPVIEELAAEGALLSVETYEPDLARAGLAAGAVAINFTGRERERAMFDVVAEHQATLVLCYVPGENVRQIADASLEDPIGTQLTYFEQRVALARSHGVTRIVIDPGMGFYYGNLTDPPTRVRYQAAVLLNTFRLRRLGLPICHAMPHAFDVFEDQFRTAEGFFAVLAYLGGTGVYRTHEVPQVRAVLASMGLLATDL